MAVNNIYSASSLMRLTGLGGSGLDTDTIVKQLMAARKNTTEQALPKETACRVETGCV